MVCFIVFSRLNKVRRAPVGTLRGLFSIWFLGRIALTPEPSLCTTFCSFAVEGRFGGLTFTYLQQGRSLAVFLKSTSLTSEVVGQ